MNCLHCGDCCLRMSPKSAPNPCPDIIKIENFYFCSCYEDRPVNCVNHDFPSRYCPIGFTKLNLQNPQEVAQRIDDGYELQINITMKMNRKQKSSSGY